MGWVILQDGLITSDGVTVIGSVKRAEGGWQVEILWQGSNGDYSYKADTYHEAIAYILGVEDAQARCLRQM